MQVISLSMGCAKNGVREGQYLGEGALRWPSERATEVEFMTVMLMILSSIFIRGPVKHTKLINLWIVSSI